VSIALFPRDYRASRRAFLDACSAGGAGVETFYHPLVGADAEPAAVDVACFGPADAVRVLIVICGTHGVEGLCGAGMQLGLLRAGVQNELGTRVRLVLVHALNPHGFLELRRTNEDNVDLNRNFVDHARPYPTNDAYSEVHPMLVPCEWEGPQRTAADEALARFVAMRGMGALQAAVSAGQYSFPDGLFYGGRAPAWSNVLWRALLYRVAGRARFAAVIDLHSGLGRRGACELISGARPGSIEHRLAERWFGAQIVFPGLTSTAPAAGGYMGTSLAEVLPDVASALVVAEIGTVGFEEILSVLRADNWQHAHGRRDSKQWRETKAAMRAAFVGSDADWSEAVVGHAIEVCRRAIAGLLDTPDRQYSFPAGAQ
jgi:hypothetical protein